MNGRIEALRRVKQSEAYQQFGKLFKDMAQALIDVGKWLYRAFCLLFKEVALITSPPHRHAFINRYFDCPRAKNLIRTFEAFKVYNYHWMQS